MRRFLPRPCDFLIELEAVVWPHSFQSPDTFDVLLMYQTMR